MAPSSSSQECHICLEELRRDLAAAPCGHVYHHVCILQALQVNSQCPICRRRTGDADVVSLYFDVPGSNDSAASPQKPAQASGDSAELSARVNTLMERIQWQNKHQQQLMDELRRLRSQSEQLLVDKQSQEQRVRSLQAANNELVNKVARYQMELSRQAEAARRSSVNQSIINYLETCDASALEDEIQNPRELIMALKKACKFRHDQYEKVVKEKTRLKEMLRNTQPQPAQQPQSAGNARLGKPKSRGATAPMETKRPYPSGSSAMGFGTGIQPPVVENKKRKIDSMASMPYTAQHGSGDVVGFTPRSKSAGFRANAYSDVSIRPPPNARQTFGRSNYNPNQYGAFNLTPASQPPVQMTGAQAAVCRRGYDETGKLTNFFLPKEGEAPSFGSSMPRKKPIPSMQNLLNSQPRASGQQQQQRVASNGRQEYALTNWLRNN